MIKEGLLDSFRFLRISLHQSSVGIMEFLTGCENPKMVGTTSKGMLEWFSSRDHPLPLFKVRPLILECLNHTSVHSLEFIRHSKDFQLCYQAIGDPLIV